jgi:phage shock protein C
MNGTSRLYRSTSEAMLGGVAAGIGNYFKIDPTFIRLAFAFLTLATGGGFLLVYLALWLLIPTAGSTASDPNQVIHENLNDIGNRFRSLVGSAGNGGNGGTATNGQTTGATNGGNGNPGQGQLPQAGSTTQARQGIGPMALIVIGGFFLLANLGFFRIIHWGMWWPLLLIGLGVIMLGRRR